MPQLAVDMLTSSNPATGEELGHVEATPAEEVAAIVERARAAQALFAAAPWKDRRALLERIWKAFAADAEDWATAIVREIGKPPGEAMTEVVATLDALRWTVKHAERVLAGERIGPSWQRWLLLPAGRLHWRPWGVTGILGTWNYPLFLNAPVIVHALAAGNGVVWKPSEFAPLLGQRLQQTLEAAGVAPGLLATVQGGPSVGQALLASDVDKVWFTGGVANGRRVLEALAPRGVPAVVELSGFDPAIVLPDAPVDSTSRALVWAAFVACGQACVAVKRVYVLGDALAFAEALAERTSALRVGNPARGEVDVGPMITREARERFDRTIRDAVAAGARVFAGGAACEGPGWFYQPTVLLADSPAAEEALAGCFGPVVVVRGVADDDAAVAAANASAFGLAASVWGRDRNRTRAIATRLVAGTVSINEAVTTTAHAAAPFGGMKASGFGCVHGALGLREFVRPQMCYVRSASAPRPQVFPYGPRLVRLLTLYRRLFHGR